MPSNQVLPGRRFHNPPCYSPSSATLRATYSACDASSRESCLGMAPCGTVWHGMAPCGIIVWHRVAGGYNKGRNEGRKNQQKGALRVADDGTNRKKTNKQKKYKQKSDTNNDMVTKVSEANTASNTRA